MRTRYVNAFAVHRLPTNEIYDELLGRLAVHDEAKRRIAPNALGNLSIVSCCSGRNMSEADLVLREHDGQILERSRAFVRYSQSRLAGLTTHAQAQQHDAAGRCHPRPIAINVRFAEGSLD